MINSEMDSKMETVIRSLPEDWKVVKLGDIGKFQYGYTETATLKPVGPKFLRITDISDEGVINWATVPYCTIDETNFKKYELREGDILIARIGATTGKTCIIKNPPQSVFASYLIRFFPKIELANPSFIYYFTKNDLYWQQINAIKEGKLKKGVSVSLLKNLLVPLPPLPEQKKIAHVLSTIQEAKEKTEAVIKAVKELKKSLMKYLFTYGPVPFNEAENVKLKETEIGLIPEDWEVVKLGELTTNIVDCLHSKKPARVEKGKILLQVYNIDKNGNLDLSNLYLISEKDFLEWSRRIKPRKGDIIISKVGRVGAIAHVDTDREFAIGRNLVVIRPDHNKVFSLFLKHFMLSPSFRKEVKRLTHVGTIHKSLHVKQVPNILVPLPPLPVQQKIASILSAVDEKIEKEENKKRALEGLFKTMLHNLMTGKVRVKDLEVENEEA